MCYHRNSLQKGAVGLRCKKLLVRIVLIALCVCTLGACLRAAAGEMTLRCEYKKITENGFVADTFMGVEARYNLTGRTLYCSELIPRFVREVFGVEMHARGTGPVVLPGFDCRYEETEDPQPGDVLLATAGSRGKSYNHWAICKAVDPEKNEMTLFEQNWRWNGCACVDRVIPLHGSCYRVYRLVTDEGRLPTLAEIAEQELAAQEAAEEAALQEALAQPVVECGYDLLQQAIRSAELIL